MSIFDKLRKTGKWVFIGIASSFVLLIILITVIFPLIGFDRKFSNEYSRITPGLTENEVIIRLGKPTGKSKVFPLKIQDDSYDDIKKTADYFLYWDKGRAMTYILAFDEQNKVLAFNYTHRK